MPSLRPLASISCRITSIHVFFDLPCALLTCSNLIRCGQNTLKGSICKKNHAIQILLNHASNGYKMKGLSRIEKMNSLDWWLMVIQSHDFSYTTILERGDHNYQ